MRSVVMFLALLSVSYAWAQKAQARDAVSAHAPDTAMVAEHASARPILPAQSVLPGLTFLLVVAFFLLAAVIGPIVRYHEPQDDTPETSSHDEHAHGEHAHAGGAAHP